MNKQNNYEYYKKLVEYATRKVFNNNYPLSKEDKVEVQVLAAQIDSLEWTSEQNVQIGKLYDFITNSITICSHTKTQQEFPDSKMLDWNLQNYHNQVIRTNLIYNKYHPLKKSKLKNNIEVLNHYRDLYPYEMELEDKWVKSFKENILVPVNAFVNNCLQAEFENNLSSDNVSKFTNLDTFYNSNEELLQAKTRISKVLEKNWEEKIHISTKEIHEFRNDFYHLETAIVFSELKNLQERYPNKENKQKFLLISEIHPNKNISLEDYIVSKNNQKLSLNDLVTNNYQNLLNHNKILNLEVTKIEMNKIHKHANIVVINNNKVAIDINSYDENKIKNNFDFKLLLDLQNKLEKEMSKEEAHNLLLLSSHKNKINVEELKNNVNEYFEIKKEEVISKALTDNVITSQEQKQINDFEEKTSQTLGGI